MLFRGLVTAGVYRARPGWSALIIRVATATAAMSVFLVWVGNAPGDWIEMGRLMRIGWLAAAVAGGALVYFATALLAGLKPAQFRVR
jgi:putative peptidoglycan lipid II flippase